MAAETAARGMSVSEPEDWSEESGNWTRRKWVKTALAIGAVGAAGVAGAAIGVSLLNPSKPSVTYDARIVYPDSGEPMLASDFEEWQGASGLWLRSFDDGSPVPYSGFPVLAIRVKRDDSVFAAPSDVSLPGGVSLYFDDPTRDIRIVVLYDRCTHFCCRPSWHAVPLPEALRDYIAPSPTDEVFHEDPVWCLCHDSMFDPMVLEKETARDGRTYVGARRVRGPADHALPVVPVASENDTLIGVMAYPEWYRWYCL